jgi:uncharacterized protein (TIGR03382 family)
MRTLLIIAAVLVSTVASAQVQVRLRFANGGDTRSVSPEDCANQRVFVTWTSTGTACQDLAIWVTEGTECQETAAQQTSRFSLTPVPVTTLNQTKTGVVEFDVSSLPFSDPTDAGTRTCGATGFEQEFRVCASTRATDPYNIGGACANSISKAAPAKITYDALAPGVPTIEEVTALDEALRVRVSEPSGSNKVKLYVALPDGTLVASPDRGLGQGDFEVEGLENGVTYQLTATAIDEAGNESGASEVVDGTPTKTNGFMQEYVNAHGKETGGCGAAGGGVAGGAVLAVLGFWLFSRRNRSWLEQ